MALPDPDSVVFIDKPNTTTPLSAAVLNPLQDRIFTRIQTNESVVPSVGQKAALAGTSGTTPSDTNRYVSQAGSSVIHVADLQANRPAATTLLNGVRFFATDKMIEYQCISAAWVITTVFAPEVTGSLPASPVDQQEAIFVADATNGVKWHFRYRAASASASKWESLGDCTPLTSEITTDESTVSTTYVAFTTPGPQITLPLAGDYMIAFGSDSYNATALSATLIAPKLGAAATSDNESTVHVSSTSNAENQVWRSMRRNGLAASAVITMQIRCNSGTGHGAKRNLEVRPIRVT